MLVLLLALVGCVREASTRQGEYLLVGQTVKGNQQIDDQTLLALVPQRPNRTFVFRGFLPYLGIYRFGEQFYNQEKTRDELRILLDSCQRRSLQLETDPGPMRRLQNRCEKRRLRLQRKIDQGNWLMRVPGEPPSYVTSALATDNAKKMQAYLVTRGFRDAWVRAALDSAFVFKGQVRVVYAVEEGPPTTLQQVAYQAAERRLDSLMEANRPAARVKPGDRFDRDALDNERTRLETLFRDNGYYGFNRSDIGIMGVDTFRTDSLRIDPIFTIAPPRRGQAHPYYTVDSVSLVVDGTLPGMEAAHRTDVLRDSVRYTFIGRTYSTRLLDSKITVRPGQLYSQSRIAETQRRLGTLDQFRFPDMPFDTTRRRLQIYTNPLDKYQFSGEVGLNVFQGLPGPFTNAALRIRNILGGLESLELAGRIGFEGQTGFINNQPYRSFEAGLNASLIFPQILFPGNYNFRFNNSNPRTQLGVGYNVTDRQDYSRTNAKLAMNYSWQKSATETFYFSIFDANLNNSRIKESAFAAYLDTLAKQGNPLKNSFQRSFVSSVSGSYVYSDNVVGQNRRAKYFRLFLELGGTTLNFTPNDEFPWLKTFFRDDSLQFFKFVRINPDFRYYLPVGLRSTLATRVNVGVGIPYGRNETLPYEKFYFLGGSNGMRAWRPRRLGPGSYRSPSDTGPDKLPEQPGNIMVELSAELRFPLIKLNGQINGAVFLDAGNVWTLNSKGEALQPANFDVRRFYREIALGTGFGVRWDFSFFIIRADWGIKMFDPTLPVGNRWVLDDFSLRRGSDFKLRTNIGIGYPF
jgi:hypothetical protein